MLAWLKRHLRFLITIAVSVIFAALFLLSVDLDAVFESLGDADYAYFAPALALFAVSVAAWRRRAPGRRRRRRLRAVRAGGAAALAARDAGGAAAALADAAPARRDRRAGRVAPGGLQRADQPRTLRPRRRLVGGRLGARAGDVLAHRRGV